MRKQLQKIIIQPDALILIERILASCVSINKPINAIRFTKNSATLLDLFERSPLPALGLLQLCQETDSFSISADLVIGFFSGTIHAKAIAEYLSHPDCFVTASGQPFLKRMAELGIHLNTQESLAQFGFLDLAFPGQVSAKNGRIAEIRENNILVKNLVLPPDFKPDKNTSVLCHLGAIITPLDHQQYKKVKERWSKSQKILSLAQLPSVIDCRNICPSSPTKKDGFDLTAWNLERL